MKPRKSSIKFHRIWEFNDPHMDFLTAIHLYYLLLLWADALVKSKQIHRQQQLMLDLIKNIFLIDHLPSRKFSKKLQNILWGVENSCYYFEIRNFAVKALTDTKANFAIRATNQIFTKSEIIMLFFATVCNFPHAVNCARACSEKKLFTHNGKHVYTRSPWWLVLFAPVPIPIVLRAYYYVNSFNLFFPSRTIRPHFLIINIVLHFPGITLFYEHINLSYLIAKQQ